MNTKPDDTQILLWLDDELDSMESASAEAWIIQNMPDHIAQRDQLRSWKAQLRNVKSADEELPYPDFFQHRVMRAIENQTQDSVLALTPKIANSPVRKKWLMPGMAVAACAILSFLIGRITVSNTPQPLITYTPEEGIQAEYFPTSPAEATVIVLNGVEELPDTLVDLENASVDSPTQETSENPIETVAP